MPNCLKFIPDNLITPLISSISIIIGAILGGIFSWIINKNSTSKVINTQSKIQRDNRIYQEQNKIIKLKEHAAIIKLDICTTLFQSLRMLKEFNNTKKINIYPIPMNLNYAEAIISLENTLSLKEMSYLYQLYGIIEKLSTNTKGLHYDESNYNMIIEDYKMFVRKLYGDNFSKALEFDIDKVSFENLYDNEVIKSGYRNILIKLNNINN